VLYFALEQGWKDWKLAFTVGMGQKPRMRTIAGREKDWKLAFTVGMGQKPRMRTIAGRETAALLVEVKKAKRRFGLDGQHRVPVVGGWDRSARNVSRTVATVRASLFRQTKVSARSPCRSMTTRQGQLQRSMTGEPPKPPASEKTTYVGRDVYGSPD
jgi:hypothetical protein